MTTFVDEMNNTNEESTLPPFDREEWIQQKRAEREKCYEMISEQAAILPKDGTRIKACLDLMSRFGKYSVNNILLLECQKPNAMQLKDFQSWKDERVSIKRGETGIMILEPGKEYTRKDGTKAVSVNVKRVFDVSQTSLPFAVPQVEHRDERLLIRAMVKDAPCRFENTEDRSKLHGRTAYYFPETNTVMALPGADNRDLFRDMTAALAAAHLKQKDKETPALGAVEACVAYILCQRNGIDTASFDFSESPTSVREMDEAGFKQWLGTIRDISNTISQDMERFFEKLKGVPARDEAR